ncbi:MAG: DNA polymerase III subunit beta [Bacteroidales bacterium]|jgi:DNA polymerase-3 subunit beta|nr:DNA polymerase III subunit beta [Bacteroidales bacterium]
MKFIVHGGTLSRSLQSIFGLITTNNVIPQLGCFLFEFQDNNILITAGDESTKATLSLELSNFETQGLKRFMVDAKSFYGRVSALGNVPLTFIVDEENYLINIKTESGRYSIAGQNAEGYPELKQIDNPSTMIVSSTMLLSAIHRTLFAVGDDETRPVMTGIFCKQTEDGIIFVSTDAHIMVKYSRRDFTCEEQNSFVLPKKPLNLIKNLVSSKEEAVDVTMQYNVQNVSFKFDNCFVVTRLIEGKFPNYEAVIPKDNPNKLIIDRTLFLNSVKRLTPFSEEVSGQIRFKLGGNEVKLSVFDDNMNVSAEEPLACNYTGDDMEIGFRYKYLNSILTNLESENIVLEMSQPNKPGIISPYEEEEKESMEDVIMLIMPIMMVN